ncbi:flavin reductase family protein [Rhizomonospora bruguierae]|uniref:flavin reductase family protein n=1 Tax=Rhizomonospora bruguierae TaxID=1581705 RepID=UPI001BD10491|nr:flavin reductase family protein [Micromonospora sp. NBRC 107566]
MRKEGRYHVVDTDRADNYKYLTASVVPRPIAWVATNAPDGSANLAPYSFFTVASPEPPTVLFSIGAQALKRSGEEKDTYTNLKRDRRLTISQVERPTVEPMVGSAAEFIANTDEFLEVGLGQDRMMPGFPPIVAGSSGALFCEFLEFIAVGISYLALCEVKHYVFRDDIFDGRHVNYENVDVVARLGGPYYSALGDVLHLPRLEPDEVRSRYQRE